MHHPFTFLFQKSPFKDGIIRLTRKDNKKQLFKTYENRADVSMTEDGSLRLINVNFSQAGMYHCHVAAKAGFINNDSYIFLNVSGKL